MATQYTPNLKLSLPTQGELSGIWGNEINNGITSMVEDAIAGQAIINTWANNFHLLTTANGAASEARSAVLKFTDTNSQITGTLATVQCPSVSKIYFVENATATPVLLKPNAGSGQTIPTGQSAILRCDGSKVVFASTPAVQNTIAVEAFGAVGNGVVDDTSALQEAFTHGMVNNVKILLGPKTYAYSGLLATIDKALMVEGAGAKSILLKLDSYTGSAFKVSATFGILGQFYPNSAQDNTTGYPGGLNLDSIRSPSFEAFSIIGKTRGAVGHGFDFHERNDMVTITDVNIFNLKGSAIRFTGERGNIRESTFTRLNVRMCGDVNTPAVDIEMPAFRNTGVIGSTVGGKTRWTITGTGDNFSNFPDAGNKKIRVQGSRLDGGTKEWPIESIISDTVVQMPYSILDNDPDNPGSAYGQIPEDSANPPQAISVPATFYKDVDGINHMVFTDCQIVGCYGTYLNISHERVNYFRRIIFNNLMVHGSNKKLQDNVFYGPSGDLILVEGGTGSVYFRGLRLNTLEQNPEVDSSQQLYDGNGSNKDFTLPYFNLAVTEVKVYLLVGGSYQVQDSGWSISGDTLTFTNAPDSGTDRVKVTHVTKYAGLRVKAGRTITTDIPDRVWINDLDMLNLENYGEGYIVAEKVKNLTINGTVARSAKSGPELIVKADAVTEAIDYNVISGTSKNVRNIGITPAFFVAANISNKVFITENQRRDTSVSIDSFRDITSDTNTTETVGTTLFSRAFRANLVKGGPNAGASAAGAEWNLVDGKIAYIPARPAGGTTLGTWVASSTSGEFYLATTSTTRLTDVSQVIENNYMILSTGDGVTIGSLGNGEWKVGDNDSLGYNTLYVKPLAPASPANMGASDIRYRTAADGTTTRVTRRTFTGAPLPNTGFYYNGDRFYDITPSPTTGDIAAYICRVRGFGDSSQGGTAVWEPFGAIGAQVAGYDNVANLVAANNLTSGDVSTRGYYSLGAGAAVYTVMTLAAYGKTPDEKGAAFTLANGYVAVFKPDGAVTDLQFGVKRDGSTDNGANLVALLAAAKDQKFEVLFTDGIAVTNTPLTIDKALFSIRGSGKLMSYLNIGSTFPEGSALLTVNDCGRTNGTGTNEKPFYTGIEKSVEMVGFTLMGNGRVRRAHGLAFTGLNDDMLIDVECRDFKGVGLSLGNADVVKVNAGSFVGGTTYKIAFLGTDTAVDPDEQEANIQARWNTYLSTSNITYKIGTEFVNPSSNGAALTGAVVATGYTSDTVRESTFENIQIKNCGNINTISGVTYDDPAMRIGSNGSNQGDNNIWFPLLRLIYSRGSALKIIPNVSNRARKIRIGHLFLHANQQLPDPGTDPNGENWHSDKDLIIVGNQGAVEGSSEIASVSVDQVDLVGLEVGHECFVVNTGSSIHVGGFTGNAPNGSYYFYFNGAETSSIRNYNRGGIRVGSPVKSTANLIKIDAMQTSHQVSVSGVAATTVPSGSKKFATLPSGQWVVGNFYVIRDLGTAGNAAWVTYLGQARPAGGDYQIGDTFTANSNDQTPLTGAICGTSGFKEGVEYKILDLGTAGNAAWVTYTGVSKTYSVGDIFTATANDSTLLTAAIVKVPYFPSYVGDIKHINDDNVIIANIYKPQDATAGASFPRTAFYVARGTTYIQKIYLVSNSRLLADDSDYATVQIIKVRPDGEVCPNNQSGVPDCFLGQIARVETKTTGAGGTGTWDIGQIIEIPFTEPRLDAGEGLAFQVFKNGSGVIVPHLGVVAELSPNLSLAGEVE
jgi:hypothetical protein